MAFTLAKNSKLRKRLGAQGSGFLEHGLGAIERILPHSESLDWKARREDGRTAVTWSDANKRTLKLRIALNLDGSTCFTVSGQVRRRKVPEGVGSISRTLDPREKDICLRVVQRLAAVLGSSNEGGGDSLAALRAAFDEGIVAAHLQGHFNLNLSLAELFSQIRRLAESSYENKALTFGCLIDAQDGRKPEPGEAFPEDFLERKRYRALSDGYHTVYELSRAGKLAGFRSLPRARKDGPRAFFPEWCRDLAVETRKNKRLAVCLTRQGDLLVLYAGSVRFTYQFGRWQYWNHSHLIDLLRQAARVQKVPRKIVPRVVTAVYRAALDVSFRRSGGLFVLLRNKAKLHELVRPGDAIGDSKRSIREKGFDSAIAGSAIQGMARSLAAELAALDGAVVLSNTGKVLAYGAILEPKRRGRILAEEGSRTKAAIGASKYGLAVKVSSDADITVFARGEEFIRLGSARQRDKG